MYALATWEQSPTFDPYNPAQIVREQYVGIPGGYGSFYFNQKPTASSLNGAGLSAIPPWAQAVVVGGLAAAVGFYGYKFAAPKLGLRGLSDLSRDRRGRFTRRH